MTTTAAADPAARRDALAERVGAAILGSLDAQAIYIGDRLGLYRALHDGGPATAPELAGRAGIDARYAREWLEHQAVGGVLDVDDVAAEPGERRYTLPEGHEAVLLDPDSLWLMAPMARFVVSFAQRMPNLLEAYRTGNGVDWSDFGADAIEAQEAVNRPQFNHLVGEWIDALPDIAARLRDGDARVADVACGTGWSSIAIARHYPAVHVDGIDIDEGSIERARANAAAQRVSDRVTFQHADAAMAAGEGRYTLATIFEAVHDMARPAEVLAAVRDLLAPGGALVVGDERVAETFTAPGDEAERMYYGYSILTCLPSGLVDKPSVGTGTVLRPAAMEAIARQAGFTGFTVLPIDHEAFRFYRLDP